MHPRARFLIEHLGLQPHPEGGWFAEVHRSPHEVQRHDQHKRSAITTIYFLLTKGELSRWHRVAADEIWHFYEGDPLALHIAELPDLQVRRNLLGPVAEHIQPVRIVPAHAWQGAHTLGDYTLIGCSVGPGFDFADFALWHDLPTEQRPALPELDPHMP